MKVLIFEFLPLTKSIDIRIEREGSQIGEYFGSAVLAIDLNNDLLDDLLVGAPFYNTQPDMIARSGDEGKVYVYLNRGDVRNFLFKTINQIIFYSVPLLL